MKNIIPVITFIILGSMVSPSNAQVSTEELARRLVGEGIEAAKERSWLVARDRFSRAYEIQPHPLTLYNLATAQEKTGMLVEASRSYRLFLRETEAEEFKHFRKVAVERRADLRKKTAFLTLVIRHIEPSDILMIGDKVVAQAIINNAIPANPGPINISVEREGQLIFQKSFIVKTGASKKIKLELPPKNIAQSDSNLPIKDGGSATKDVASNALPTATLNTRSSALIPPSTVVGKTTAEKNKKRSVLSSPWLWTVVGTAVAVGAGTGLYFALQPSDPYNSTLNQVTIGGR